MSTEADGPCGSALSEGLGPNAPKLTIEQVCNIGFAVLRAHNDDRLWRALTYDSGPYDLTTPNLALQELGAAFYAAGYAEAPRTTMKVEVSSDPEMVRRTLRAEAEVALLRAALDQKHAEYEDLQRHGNNTAHNLARMQAAIAENASRSADYLRKAIKWESRAAELATDAQRYRILRNCNMDVRNRLEHYGGDALDERLDALNSLALGPNGRAKLDAQAKP